jgi:hypothetical protein
MIMTRSWNVVLCLSNHWEKLSICVTFHINTSRCTDIARNINYRCYCRGRKNLTFYMVRSVMIGFLIGQIANGIYFLFLLYDETIKLTPRWRRCDRSILVRRMFVHSRLFHFCSNFSIDRSSAIDQDSNGYRSVCFIFALVSNVNFVD